MIVVRFKVHGPAGELMDDILIHAKSAHPDMAMAPVTMQQISGLIKAS